MFKLDTPSNVNEMQREEAVKLVKPRAGMPSLKNRTIIYESLMRAWGLTMSNDVLMALLSEAPAQLVIATAGSGKTTLAIAKIIGIKLFRKNKNGEPLRGDRILYLIYNKENTRDVQNRHLRFLNRLPYAGFSDNINLVGDLASVPPEKRKSGIYLDTQLKISTMHAFCEEWRKEYAGKLNMLGMTALRDEESNTLMDSAAKLMLEKHGMQNRTANATTLKSLYNLMMESVCNLEDLQFSDRFRELSLPLDVVNDIFMRYEKNKASRRKYDFTDMLVKFYHLLLEDKAVLERIRKRFDYIIADEYQDFTPIMSKILELIAKDNTPLLCVGDEDQNLYSFRGSDINNILEFTKRFPDAEVYSLQYNRRCAKEIFDLSCRVIKRNSLRFDKTLQCASGRAGKVDFMDYSNPEGQAMQVIQEQKKIPEGEWGDTYVCYRERVSSMILSELLYDAGIPVHVLSGYLPYSHELYGHVAKVLLALAAPKDLVQTLALYKVLPVSKSAWYEDLGYDAKRGRFLKEKDDDGNNLMFMHFAKRKYLKCSRINGFGEAMHNLIKISTMIQTDTMDKYFPTLFNQFLKYFWKFKVQVNGMPEYDSYFEKKVYDFFNRKKLYTDVIAHYEARKKVVSANQSNSVGVTLATFHKLKGLEFKHGFIVDMDESIFPNFSLIDSRDYPEDVKLRLKESETRLYFVAITRAKETLHILYSKTNPSRYVRDELHGSFSNIQPSNIYRLSDFNSTPEVTEVAGEVPSTGISLDGLEDFSLDSVGEELSDLFCGEAGDDVALPQAVGEFAGQIPFDGTSEVKDSFVLKGKLQTGAMTSPSFLNSLFSRLG